MYLDIKALITGLFKKDIYIYVCVCVYIKYVWGMGASQVLLVVQNPPSSAEDIRDMGLIPGSEKSCGKGRGNTLQYSCLENPMDRGAPQATVHRFAKSQAHA